MRIVRFCVPAALLLAAASCSSEKPGAEKEPPEVSDASSARVRRLTRVEYDNSLAAVVPGMPSLSGTFAPEDTILGFSTHDRLQVTSLLADQMDNAAQNAAIYARSQLKVHDKCPADANEEKCTTEFFFTVASKAFRRPLTDDDKAALVDFWRETRKTADPQTAHQIFLQGLFSSASFLYRTELGAPGEGANQVVRLTPYEVASAISYAITAAPPDAELLAAADADALKTADQREAQARRLMATPAAQKRLAHFIREWLGITGLANLNKNNQVFPAFSAAFKDSSQSETRAFIDHVIANEGGSVKELLSADYTFADGRMSAFYGTTSTPNGVIGRVPLPADRAGILTEASVLATYALFDSSSPIRRGKFVLTRLMCRTVPPPPASIVIIPPAPAADSTTRARFAAHTNNPTCATCHRTLDPIGFGFENFDGLGKSRTMENGIKVDASGSVEHSSGTFSFTGGAELARFLATSEDVANCVPLQVFRYAMGRDEDTFDEPVLADMRAAFKANPRLQLGDAFVSLVRSPYFVNRRTLSP
ncbi:DUF1592 domain-containing protein [Pyxidicoccus parkwayensis]|uniref:DUF1592 domain-containing protein n=1 Tax=Pyxidicoccus parkwayensis TaxID=2813578 RepID=A0ABX7P1X4_9BACT|nr:DUF1592 domain-containing protein [Pyxidicoccus parkwaysis]QSQ24190.1 DUF1592 domain-containing protein [Pyxidicoccus parkwaysis]